MFEQRCFATEFVVDEDCVGFEPLEVAQTIAFEGVASTRMDWLGGRDSNPDNVLQRHASYRWTTSQSGCASGMTTARVGSLWRGAEAGTKP